MTAEWEADVVVMGGGMAGIGAAIASARTGAKTILIERAGWLGGIGITGATGLHSFFNIYGAEPGAPRRKLVGGIAQELVDRVRDMGGGIGHVVIERGGDFISMLTPVEPETFKLAAARTCRESGVKLLLHTVCVDAEAADGEVKAVRVWSKAGFATVRGRQFIDCSGEGDLAAASGADYVRFKPGDDGNYFIGFTFRLCNVDLGALEAYLEREGLLRHMAHAVKPYMTEPELVRLSIDVNKLRERGVEDVPQYFYASSLRPRELTYCNCINFDDPDSLSPEDLTEAELYLRGRMFDIAALFREQFEGCGACYPAGPAPAVGPRRARAIRCDYELTQDDVTSGARFDDEIGLFGFIDHPKCRVKDAGGYGLPYRALRPTGLDNVLIAGKMMTVELVAHNTTRNTVCCLVCGQGAGTAAALATQADCTTREVDVGQLRTVLSGDGVLLEPQEE
ncbi:MAG: FAD-dependent oxidoreductase [Planctomycetota bacterium]|jgi:hypothetical protein